MNYQKKILVIDGDHNFIDAFTAALPNNYVVKSACDGEAGIQKAVEFNPDLILCEAEIHPMGGYQVFTKLKDTLIQNKTSFVFLKENAGLDDFRLGMNLGADDFLSKPIKMNDLIRSIKIRLQKFEPFRYEPSKEFNALFQLSPIGIILFNDKFVLKTNKTIQSLLKIESTNNVILSLEDLFSSISLPGIKNWIHQSINGVENSFNESIVLKDCLGEELKMNLTIYNFLPNQNHIQFAGFFTPLAWKNNHLANDQLAIQICNLLKREKIAVSEGLQAKIMKVIKQKAGKNDQQNNLFFTRRENQVLYLSMEGLPIKIIADKLSISTRTVEKYRTKLMEKSGANNIVEVIVFSLKNGLIKI